MSGSSQNIFSFDSVAPADVPLDNVSIKHSHSKEDLNAEEEQHGGEEEEEPRSPSPLPPAPQRIDPLTRFARYCCGQQFWFAGVRCGPKRLTFAFLIFAFIFFFLLVNFLTITARSAKADLFFDFPEETSNTSSVLTVKFLNITPGDRRCDLALAVEMQLDRSFFILESGPPKLNRDIVLQFERNTAQIKRGTLLKTLSFNVIISGGTVYNYPFDSYFLNGLVYLYSREPDWDYQKESFSLIVERQDVNLFTFETRQVTIQGDEGLRFDFYRPALVRMYPCLVICGFWFVLMGQGLLMTSNIFLKQNRNNPAQIITITSTLFALPALRNSMPSAPPYGSTIDFMGFFWAELCGFLTFLVLSISYWRDAYIKYKPAVKKA